MSLLTQSSITFTNNLFYNGLNFIASLTTLRERSIYTAGVGLSWGVGAILGPVIGGAFANGSATWRWVSLKV